MIETDISYQNKYYKKIMSIWKTNLSRLLNQENKMENMNFNKNDLDKDLLHKIIEKNINSIYNSPRARRGRTREQVSQNVSSGIPCEVFLIEKYNYLENNEKYGDVINQDGLKIECKSSIYEWNEQKKKNIINKIKIYNPSSVCLFWKQLGDNYIFQGSMKIK